jgi:uncharacterized protein
MVLMAGAVPACARASAPSAPSIGAAPVEVAELPTRAPTAVIRFDGPDASAATASAPASLEPTASPTATASPPPTETPPPTATPAPTPTHPLMIEVMRQQAYPGSELVFEQTLGPGANYDRHIVSYYSEGYKIFALLTVPWGQRPATGWPVIIFNHGYIPPTQYRTTERYLDYMDAFARNGYMVFRSDYRGHGSSEGDAVGGYSSPAYTADVLNGLASVKRYPEADPGRIGMWGHSMGGFITLRAMVVSGEIRAGVIWGGVVASFPDLFDHWWRRAGDGPTPTPDPTRPRGRWRFDLIDTYGTVDENPAFWAAISSNSYVANLSGPVQLHHATTDAVVPVALSEILYGELQAAGVPAELYLYEGDNHNIYANFWTAMNRSIAFFDAYLKGEG